VGPAATPLLWAQLRREAKPKRRLFWVGAFAAAAGGSAHRRLLQAAWFKSAKKHEQLIALLALSLGSASGVDAAAVFRLASDSPSDAVRLAASIAISHASEEFTPPPNWLGNAGSRDPGMCAGAVLSSGVIGRAAAERWLDTGEIPAPRAQLVWRALLLTRQPGTIGDAMCLELAKQALSWDSELSGPLRSAASERVARALDPASWILGEPGPELLLALGRSAAGRDKLLQLGWLESVPSQRIDARTRGQLAVVFALAASQRQIEAAAPRWRSDDELAPAACLGLAWRALSDPDGLSDGTWLDALDTTPQAAWVRLALGDRPRLDPQQRPPRRAGALDLAIAGRLPRSAMKVAVERELWRRHTHPGLAGYECWVALYRDLLLSGSQYARSQDARPDDYPYLPSDLRAGNREFFEVACEFLSWVVSDAAEVPARFAL